MTDYYPTLKKGRKEKEKVDKEKKKIPLIIQLHQNYHIRGGGGFL